MAKGQPRPSSAPATGIESDRIRRQLRPRKNTEVFAKERLGLGRNIDRTDVYFQIFVLPQVTPLTF